MNRLPILPGTSPVLILKEVKVSGPYRKTIIIPGYGFKVFLEAPTQSIVIDEDGERQVLTSEVWDEFHNGSPHYSAVAKEPARKGAGSEQPVSERPSSGGETHGMTSSLSVRQAAAVLGCSKKTVHALCDKGQLHCHWVGKRRMLRHEDIVEFREARQRDGTRDSRTPVDGQKGSRILSARSRTYAKREKGGAKESNIGKDNRTETEILASIRERMREWD